MSKTIPRKIRLCEAAPIKFKDQSDEDRESGVRRFEMVAYTGAEVDFFGKMITDLKGMVVGHDKKKPILQQHRDDQIVGFSEGITKNDQLLITGKLIEGMRAGREVATAADNGFPWQASMSFFVDKVVEIAKGETRKVNGRDFKGPGLIVTKSRFREASFVPLGADSKTTAQVFTDDEESTIEVELSDRKETSMSGDEQVTKMTAAEFAAQNPDQVEAWRKEGADKDRAEIVQQFGALNKEFGEARPAFVCAQFAKGNDLLQAKAELSDVLQKELEERGAENDALKKQMAQSDESSGEGDDGGVGFGAKTSETSEEEKMIAEALKQADGNHEKAFDALQDKILEPLREKGYSNSKACDLAAEKYPKIFSTCT